MINPPALPPEARRALVDSVARARESMERQLAARSAVFRTMESRDRIGLPEVRAQLGPKDVLLAYVVYEGRPRAYAALALRGGDGKVLGVRIGRADSVEVVVQRWMQEVRRDPAARGRSPRDAETACRQAGEELRRLVWDPVAGHWGRARHIFVVPDGVLQLVNLSALPAPGGGYLVEKGPLLHFLATERDLVPIPAASRSTGGLLALGGPDFDVMPGARATVAPAATSDASSPLHGVRFAPLPAARREAEEVLQTWQASNAGATPAPVSATSECLVGPDATEDRFKQEAPGKQVLHLATHGFFLGAAREPDDETTRGIGTGVRPAAPRDSLEAARRNPLLRAGLALAGANVRSVAPGGEDGILTAEEVAALDLRGVEWAVLSACDTGLGTVREGEGIFGLRRSFQIAGVHTVIASLWAVRDDRARAWMATLYRARYAGHHSTAESVRDANTAALADLRTRGLSDHPYLWAGFVAVGE